MYRIYLLIAAGMALPLIASENAVSGPVLGYCEKDAVIRPILGIPGAAYFGNPVETAGSEIAALSSSGGFAVMIDSSRTQARIVRLQGDHAQIDLFQAPSEINSVRLSPEGTAAAITHSNGSVVEVFGSLPASPAHMRTVAGLADVTMAAVSDDGAALALIFSMKTMQVLKAGSRFDVPVLDPRHMAFRPASHELAVIDADQLLVWSTTSSAIIAGASEGVSAAGAAIPTRDGALVYLLNAGGKEFLIASRSGEPVQRHALPCAAADAERSGDSVVLILCEGKGVVHLFENSQRGPRLLFVPEPVQ